MDKIQVWNHNLATIGWGALFIWWGIAIAVDPITIGMAAVGTGLIMLGVSAARWRLGIPAKGSTITLGLIALVWGTLDTALGLRFGASFATLMIIIGVVGIASLWVHPNTGLRGS